MKTILVARANQQKWLQYRMTEETFNLLDGFVVGGALRMGWSRLEELIEMLPSGLKKMITKSEVDPPKNGRTMTFISFDEAVPEALSNKDGSGGSTASMPKEKS